MRPGLVFVGIALMVVGAAVFATFVLLPGPSTETFSSVITSRPIAANQSQPVEMSSRSAPNGNVQVTWEGTQNLSVSLFLAVPCPGQPATLCTSGAALATWHDNVTGSWGTTALGNTYLWEVGNLGDVPAVFVASEHQTVTTSQSILPVWSIVSLAAGGGALLLVGALAIFLGTFLRGGVYQGPAPVMPRGPDDLPSMDDEDGLPARSDD